MQGKHQNHKRNWIPRWGTESGAHITFFPTRESHYFRVNIWKMKYLDSTLNLSEIFHLFKSNNPEVEDKTEWVDRDIFNFEYNISCGFPRADLCDTCECLTAESKAAKAKDDGEKVRALTNEDGTYKRKGDAFYEQLRELTDMAREKNGMVLLSIDFQKNISMAETSQEYYKRQLAVHYLCIHDCNSGKANMHVYPENYAGNSSNEVVSCLDHFISTISTEIKQLVLFTDNCFSQNKNRFWQPFPKAFLSSTRSKLYALW